MVVVNTLYEVLIYLIVGDSVYLAKTKDEPHKPAGGKYNGYGGKIEDGQSPLQAAVDELEKESGLRCSPDDLVSQAQIKFFIVGENKPRHDVVIFTLKKFVGTPVSTDEMRDPKLFPKTNLPFKMMLPSDEIFLPRILEGEEFYGWIRFTEGMKSVDDSHLKKFIKKP